MIIRTLVVIGTLLLAAALWRWSNFWTFNDYFFAAGTVGIPLVLLGLSLWITEESQ